jgi:hypothetical protein
VKELILLLHVWVAEPIRAIAGIGGLICLVWALLPLARTESRRGAGFIGDMRDLAVGIGHTGPRGWTRATVGIVGFATFLWSASPIAWMR